MVTIIGLTEEQIKQIVLDWYHDDFHVRSQLDFAIQTQDTNMRLGKTMGVLLNQALPSLLSRVITENNKAISRQLYSHN